MTGDSRSGRDETPEHRHEHIERAIREHEGAELTTDQGAPVSDDQNTLRAGARGPSLMDDFIMREKITHFDHERIPERVVHARGAGAHGYFEPYESMAEYTSAAFLRTPGERTPVFVRFSTVAGSRGSADTARDVRGFATKFYTSEGNFDLVGNNIPVFFIQDAIKFPDLVHAVKPEPHNEIPQATAAHDTFWDFVWLSPESTHMTLWLMSDRAIPRAFSMMDGFGVHTFRLVNDRGVSHFVKFHWKPVLGTHSLVWDEAQRLGGMDPDVHRRHLWNSIEEGNYPEYELGVQIIPEEDEHRFAWDILDPTKIWPEEMVPVQPVGKMVLDRNPENFFVETEQIAFHIGNLVPGLDVTNDPLLQGRLFSYLDTQLIRLGGPNFPQIPINHPVTQVRHNQRDGFQQRRVDRGRVSYSPNSLRDGDPRETGHGGGGFESYPAPVDGPKVRERSESFNDHFSQAALFWNSMSEWEQAHIVSAYRFELGKVGAQHVRARVVDLLAQVDVELASQVAEGIGVDPPRNADDPAGEAMQRLREGWERFGSTAQPGPKRDLGIDRSPALSQANAPRGDLRGRRVAILVAEGVDADAARQLREALEARGATGSYVAPLFGTVPAENGDPLEAEASLHTEASVVFDAVFVPGGEYSASRSLSLRAEAVHFVAEAYKHCKPIGASGAGAELLATAGIADADRTVAQGVVSDDTAADGQVSTVIDQFIEALGQHRFYMREGADRVPA